MKSIIRYINVFIYKMVGFVYLLIFFKKSSSITILFHKELIILSILNIISSI